MKFNRKYIRGFVQISICTMQYIFYLESLLPDNFTFSVALIKLDRQTRKKKLNTKKVENNCIKFHKLLQIHNKT